MKNEIKKECNDPNCPFHGDIKTRGRTFTGTVISTKMQKTAVVEWERLHELRKYERFEKRRSKLKAHVPECLTVVDGDIVKISECRPLSKTKNFVVVEVLGAEKGFSEKMQGRDEAKVKSKKLDKEKPEEIKEEAKDETDKVEDN